MKSDSNGETDLVCLVAGLALVHIRPAKTRSNARERDRTPSPRGLRRRGTSVMQVRALPVILFAWPTLRERLRMSMLNR